MSHVSSLKLGVALGLAALCFAVVSADNNWPQFRGAQGGVAADDPSLPDAWGPSQNIVWKIDVPGRSWSSPVVWGDHVFVTTAINTAEAETLLPVSAYVSRSNGGTMTFRDLAHARRRTAGCCTTSISRRARFAGSARWPAPCRSSRGT